MDTERWKRLRALYEAAAELPPAAREAHLQRECADDPELAAEVRRMLASADEVSERGSDFLEPIEGAPLAARTPGFAPAPGTRIGSFVVGEPIASGGMGTVYLALQEEPRRRVALKLLHRGAGSPSAVRRFRFEAELLAQLEHPGIATVFEAGVHEGEDGSQTPYLAMEYVEDARDILTWARERRLDATGRIELFLEVCSAAQHGHQLGVVHRDLKPQNILVDRHGRVRVIDFGIARALGRGSMVDGLEAPETQLTGAGELVGTLGYMSPEQFGADSRLVDTRSDVYSLGVVLHELLCGRPPFELAGSALLEFARTVCDEPPTPPADLPRDLGWVLCKALAKRPEERYASASELAADLGRYLADEPVEAGAPSATYRWSKFVRRNRAAVVLAVVALLALVGGGLTATFGLFEARRAGVALVEERDTAVAEAAKFESMSDVLTGMLLSVSPEQDGREVRVADVLDRASAALTGIQDPDVAAPVRYVLGRSYANLDLRERAIAELELAAELVRGAPDEEPEALAWIQRDLAGALAASGRGSEALVILDGARDEARAALGDEAPVVFALAATRVDALLQQRALDDGLSLAERESQRAERVLGPLAPETLALRAELGWALKAVERDWEALEVMTETLRRNAEVEGPLAPVTLQARFERAELLGRLGRTDEGLAEMAALLPLYESTWGRGTARTCRLQAAMADVAMDAGRLDEAYALLLSAVPCLEATLDPSSGSLVRARGNLAAVLDRMGDDESALAVRRSAWEQAQRFYGEDDDRALFHAHGVAIQLQKLRRSAEALAIEDRVAEAWRAERGLEDANTLEALEIRAKLLVDLGRLEEALGLLRELLDVRTRLIGPEHPVTLRVHNELMSCLAYMGRLEEALEEGERVHALHRRALPDSDPSRVIVVRNLGAFARDLGRLQLAVEYSREAWRLCTEHRNLDVVETGLTGLYFGEALLLTEQLEEAVPVLEAAAATFLERPGAVPQFRARCLVSLGTAQRRSGRAEEARAAYARALELYEQLGDRGQAERLRTALGELEGQPAAPSEPDEPAQTESGQ